MYDVFAWDDVSPFLITSAAGVTTAARRGGPGVRYAVIADVHTNLEALDAVLEAARARGADRIVCAGNIVGYHADPNAVIARLREASAICIAGNHDCVAAGLAEPTRFGAVARRAALWTRAHLSPEGRAFLAALPLHAVVDGRFLVFHGALTPSPDPDLYMNRDARISRSIQALRDGPFQVRLAFFGHTHRRAVHEAHGSAWRSREASMIELYSGAHYLVNPGSVGQPRDGDPRAAFCTFEVGAAGHEPGVLRLCRVPFDSAACLAKTARAGLLPEPRPLAGAVRRGLAALRRLA